MRFGRSFHPEWGYLAPAPNFMRTARLVVVATAIGATAGAAVVLSLVERPAASAADDPGKTLVVVHSLVQPAETPAPVAAATPTAPTAAVTTEAVAPIGAPPAAAPARDTADAQASAPPSQQVQALDRTLPATISPTSVASTAPAPSDSRTATTAGSPASVAALAEAPPADEAASGQTSAPTNIAADPIAPQKKVAKKRRTAEYDPWRVDANGYPKKKTAPNQQGLGLLFRQMFSNRASNSY